MILNIEGLYFNYPSHSVLKNITFSLNKGECLAILGTNGAGKSTLLKCINRIIKPKKGKLFIENIDVNKLSATQLAQNIGYVAQSSQRTRITVFDSVLIGRKPYIKWDISEKDLEIVNKAIKELGLEEYALRYIDELSGGELQKVWIARALAQQPKILMLDEPTSNLDLKNQLEVINIIKRVVKNNDISAIITIHDLNLALRVADKFIFIKNGEVFAAGGREIITPENIELVYSVPVTVRSFDDNTLIVPV